MFQFKRMPFGLGNAPATFQRALGILLSGYRWRTCSVYLDDVIVFSSTFEDLLRDVRDVLTILREDSRSKSVRLFGPRHSPREGPSPGEEYSIYHGGRVPQVANAEFKFSGVTLNAVTSWCTPTTKR